ncbi:MAG: hypothetical protein PF439_10540 [Helicobacteraceae bacterium]|jgi:hypothetical protein|nr:hypothetical protein [Helicobacteraceae bacterium]
MKNRILFIGSIIFASSVVFGEILVTLPQSAQMVSQIPVSFEEEIEAQLVSRGLEEQAAKEFSQNSVEDVHNAMLLTYMITTKLGIERTQVHAYIASQSLFQKCVDLRSHDDVVAMLQKIKGVSMHKEDLKAIEEYIAIV